MNYTELQNRFGFHPATESTRELHATLREQYLELADVVLSLVPEGREQALALTDLQESLMWANAGVACNLAPLE